MVNQVPIYPSVMRRAIGRPKKVRNKTSDEPRNPYILSRRVSTITCKKIWRNEEFSLNGWQG